MVVAAAALQEVVALLGCPAAGNPAQYLFERMIAAAGLDWQFVTLDVPPERIAEAIAGVSAMGFRGCLLAGALRTSPSGHCADEHGQARQRLGIRIGQFDLEFPSAWALGQV